MYTIMNPGPGKTNGQVKEATAGKYTAPISSYHAGLCYLTSQRSRACDSNTGCFSRFVLPSFANHQLALSPALCWEKLFQLFAYEQLSGSV